MSVQSDCEMIFIHCIEEYKKNYFVSTDEANIIFQNSHIFEKILLQHEYLHQVSLNECYEYVLKEIKEESNDITVFHGTCFDFSEIDLTKSHNYRDFGKGFYTTILMPQSKEWAYRLALREKKDKYFIYEYLFEDNETLNVKHFDSLNEEWLEFIKENRIKGGLQHNYDVVIGPVADDNTMETVQLYMSNLLTAKEAVKRLKYNKVNNQVSFHTKNALKHLKLVRRIEFNE